MRCARADAARARLRTVALLGLVLAVVVGCARGTEVAPPSPSPSASASGDAEARRVVGALEQALQGAQRVGDDAPLDALAAPGGEALLADVADNVGALRLRQVSLRFLERDAPLVGADAERWGSGAFAVRVALGYAYARVDEVPAEVETTVVLAPTGDDAFGVVGFGAAASGTRTPLWLLDRLRVSRRGADLLVVAGDDPAVDRLPRLLSRARAQVAEVLPGRDGPLVVERPRDTDQLDAMLAASPGRFAAVAGLATTADGSGEPRAPVRVVLNPAVFDGLSRRGAQVVLTHEATHVAVGAPFSEMPVWLLEGFADYVALADGSVPVEVAAGQALAQVRAEGPPRRLPDEADLEPTAGDLGATYEVAWLAVRYLAAAFGERAVVRLYERVDDGAPLRTALNDVLGTSEREVVRGWRADLRALARVAP